MKTQEQKSNKSRNQENTESKNQKSAPATSKNKKKKEPEKKKLEECKKERDEYLKGWQRAKADFVNYKKEEDSRFLQRLRRHKESFIESVLPVLDSFDLSLLSSKGDTVEKKGVELIRNQLLDALKNQGVERIDVNPGDEFNPAVHEAVERVESDQPSDTVIEETERGYKFKDKVIRPSKVKVSK